MYATATSEIKRPASVSSGPKNPPRGHRMGVLSKDSSFMRLLNIRERRYDEWGTSGEGTKFAVIFIDLDEFKQINDRCGHDMGDALLREFAKLALDGFRTTDFVARLAGDEFVAGVEDLPASGNEPESILQRLREKLDVDLVLGDKLLRISASIGAAVSDGTTDGASLLRRAGQAMYLAKQQGKNQTIISQ